MDSTSTPGRAGPEVMAMDKIPAEAAVPDLAGLPEAVEATVEGWLDAADDLPTPWQGRLLPRLLTSEDGLAFAVRFADGVVRPEDRDVAAQHLARLGRTPPSALPVTLRWGLRIAGALAPVVPTLVVPAVRRTFRALVGHLVVDASDRHLRRALSSHGQEGVLVNVNLLGEAVLGPQEASRRLARLHDLVARPDVEHVSVKVSAVVAPHAPWAHEETVDRVVEALRPLYVAAASVQPQTFLNLDMEEYRDLELTLDVFERLHEESGLQGYGGGVVLQAYLPDSLPALRRLHEYAARRVAGGGAPVRVRLVKGANLPMERVEAELRGWPLATWGSKLETDAHYKRLVLEALDPSRLTSLQVGVAGHNLYDVAFALELAARRGVTEGLDVEMLLGMAPAQTEVVRREIVDRAEVDRLVLYMPVVQAREFAVAISYLVRRLEEGASDDNFLPALHLLDDPEVRGREARRFRAALAQVDVPVPDRHRIQDRQRDRVPDPRVLDIDVGFTNAADSDPATLGNRRWASTLLTNAEDSALGVAGVRDARVQEADVLGARAEAAVRAGRVWAEVPVRERAHVLLRLAAAVEQSRGVLVEVMVSECHKTLDQADPEVSEAVDFARWYAARTLDLAAVDGARTVPTDAVLVVPPWNFPVAIPASGVLAALAVGSAAVLKPAPEAERCAAVLVDVLRTALEAAGAPEDLVQLVVVDEGELGRDLVADRRFGRVLLTGSFETAELFRSFRPDLPLLAETSGKNALVVTPSADFDLAARDLAYSAFGHTGQKCSAASLGILVGSVATSRRFRQQLVDAVTAMQVGPAWEATTAIAPLVQAPREELLRVLTELEPGESWLVRPECRSDDGRLWSPGVKEGVRSGSSTHLVEFFGPLLGLMAVKDLDEALAVQNQVEYGLTAGLHSLDEDEVARWIAGAEAGNLYVNRHITGALVGRQPFGGWKRSAVGAGFKVGGPYHLFGLVDWVQGAARVLGEPDDLVRAVGELADQLEMRPGERQWLHRALLSDVAQWDSMRVPRDLAGLDVEHDVHRVVPEPTYVRVGPNAVTVEVMRVLAAGVRCGGLAGVSCSPDVQPTVLAAVTSAGRSLDWSVPIDDSVAWCSRLGDGNVRRVRAIGFDPLSAAAQGAGRTDVSVHVGTVVESGLVELLAFVREQSISVTAHRYGTLNRLPDSTWAPQ